MIGRMVDRRYPIGLFSFDPVGTPDKRSEWCGAICRFPVELGVALEALPPGGLDTPYRPGGWTVRQVVHHVADSHVNAYCRLRLALTEVNPVIRTYDEAAWAELADAKTADPALSVSLLQALHGRWHLLLLSLASADFKRRVQHPERGVVSIDWLLQMYAWHGRHHLGHIRLVSSQV